MKRIVLLAALAAGTFAGPAWSQSAAERDAARADTVIRGGGIPSLGETSPETRSPADSTGSIAETGRRKPPGAPLGEDSGTRPDLERKSREIDRRIRTGICRGC